MIGEGTPDYGWGRNARLLLGKEQLTMVGEGTPDYYWGRNVRLWLGKERQTMVGEGTPDYDGEGTPDYDSTCTNTLSVTPRIQIYTFWQLLSL